MLEELPVQTFLRSWRASHHDAYGPEDDVFFSPLTTLVFRPKHPARTLIRAARADESLDGVLYLVFARRDAMLRALKRRADPRASLDEREGLAGWEVYSLGALREILAGRERWMKTPPPFRVEKTSTVEEDSKRVAIYLEGRGSRKTQALLKREPGKGALRRYALPVQAASKHVPAKPARTMVRVMSATGGRRIVRYVELPTLALMRELERATRAVGSPWVPWFPAFGPGLVR